MDLVAPPGATGSIYVIFASVVRVPIRRVAVRALRIPDDVLLYRILNPEVWVCVFGVLSELKQAARLNYGSCSDSKKLRK
jgi:hypothetical protein